MDDEAGFGIVLKRKMDMNAVFSALNQLISNRGYATVSDLYSLCDLSTVAAQEKVGWVKPVRPASRRVSNGYLLAFPQPVALD